MTSATLASPALSKEIRGLLPLWAACIAALAGALIFRSDGWLMLAAIAAYVVGPVALGAQSIGQEYAYRTLPMLLSQPADRRRVFLLKFAVAAVMIMTLAAFGSTVLLDVARRSGMWCQVNVQILPVLGGLFVAPWVTMICRSSLAGILATGSFAALTFILQTVIVGLWYGVDAGTAQAMSVGPWSAGMIACSAVAGVLGVRRFIHLEAIDGPLPSLHFPRWLAASGRARVYRPLRALAAKELRLQQLTFVIAGACVVATVAISEMQRLVPSWLSFPVVVAAQLSCMILSIWIGAIASAEERQHGTLEWQLLQPVPAWQQWMVKVGVAFAVALVCGVVVPVLLFQNRPGVGTQILRVWSDLAVAIVLATSGGIYLSSLSSSGVRAMVLTLPVGMAVILWIRAVGNALYWGTTRVAGRVIAGLVTGAISPVRADPADLTLFAIRGFALTLVPVLLWFGFINHTSSERPVRRVLQQGAAIAAIIMLGVVAAGGFLASYELRPR